MFQGSINVIRDRVSAKMEKAVPSHVNIFHCFGGISLLLIMLQVVTGIVMLFYFIPDPEKALLSIETMSNEVFGGWLLRDGHRWGSTILLAFVFSHMIIVFYFKAYQNPRQLTWTSGVGQLVIVFLMVTTGVLLPWDWRAYWAYALWMDYIATWPLIGGYLKELALDTFTLNWVFYTHVLFLPLILGGSLILHFRMVRKYGITKPL
jgi:quinol-cytochrome oxidoreductase complex cytochrome b subunit